MYFHTLFHPHVFSKNTNGRDQIDCKLKIIGTKLIATSKYMDKIVFLPLFEKKKKKRKKKDKGKLSIDSLI